MNHAVLPPDQASALDDVLAGYAAGSLPRALHALVGAHLELSSANRAYVAALEEARGEYMMRAPQASHGSDQSEAMAKRAARLDAIFATSPTSPGKPTPPSTPVEPDNKGEDVALPRALRHFLGKPLEELKFSTVLPGVQECRIDAGDGMRALVYRIRPGRAMPQHSHDGGEITLVLRGGFSDVSGHYGRGDIALADDDVDHVPVADPGEECICFAVIDAPLRLTGPVGRFFNRFLKH